MACSARRVRLRKGGPSNSVLVARVLPVLCHRDRSRSAHRPYQSRAVDCSWPRGHLGTDRNGNIKPFASWDHYLASPISKLFLLKALDGISMPPQTHDTILYHPPLTRDAAAVMGEEARTAQFHRWTSRDSVMIPRGVAPELEHRRWQGHDHDHKFWIHESPPSSVSQDGRSNASSEGHPSTAGSAEGAAEERRGRTVSVSPYGSFFAEEMEFDYGPPPADVEGSSFYWGDGQECETVLSDMNGAFRYRATQRIPRSQSRWTTTTNPRRPAVPVAPMEPALFVAGYPVYARPPVAVPAPEREALGAMEASLSRLSLAENSRQSQPPVSWRQGYYFDHPNNPRWGEPPQAATASPLRRSLSGHDRRQMQGMAPRRRRK